METEQQYERWTAGLRAHPALAKALVIANKILTAIGYVSYPLLLVLLFFFQQDYLIRCIVIPVVGFALCTAIRYFCNSPRPYEKLDIDPIIKKGTHGKSFPSRHTFCMFTIAMSWFIWQPAVGVVLLASGCFMGVIRVLGGVHFPRDVIIGAILAVVICILGYYQVPWLLWPWSLEF